MEDYPTPCSIPVQAAHPTSSSGLCFVVASGFHHSSFSHSSRHFLSANSSMFIFSSSSLLRAALLLALAARQHRKFHFVYVYNTCTCCMAASKMSTKGRGLLPALSLATCVLFCLCCYEQPFAQQQLSSSSCAGHVTTWLAIAHTQRQGGKPARTEAGTTRRMAERQTICTRCKFAKTHFFVEFRPKSTRKTIQIESGSIGPKMFIGIAQLELVFG